MSIPVKFSWDKVIPAMGRHNTDGNKVTPAMERHNTEGNEVISVMGRHNLDDNELSYQLLDVITQK